MIGSMTNKDHFTIECSTCLAAATTACTECVLTYVLANDDGPVDYLAVRLDPLQDPQERAISLFLRAGLLDDPVEFVPLDIFESFASDDAVMTSPGG